jgi:hypothetical protein
MFAHSYKLGSAAEKLVRETRILHGVVTKVIGGDKDAGKEKK